MRMTITNQNTAKLTFAKESTKKAIAIATILRNIKNVKLGETDRKTFIEFNFSMSEKEFKSLYHAASKTVGSTKVIENITTPKVLTLVETIMQYHKDEKFAESPIRDYETLYMEFGCIREAEAERFKDLLPTIYMLYTDDDLSKPIYTGHAGDYDFADLEIFAEEEKALTHEYIFSERWQLKANGDLWLGDELIFNKL